jgi:hypothetical protein
MPALKKLITHGWKHATTIIFVVGFFMDSFLLPSVDEPITKYLGMSYLIILAGILMLREWVVSRNTASKIEQRLFGLLTFGVSFVSGAALSFVFVYAMRSAAFVVSWPLFVILLICMTANEFISTHNYRFTLDVAVYYIALVFYSIFNVPILFGVVNDFVFLVAIGISIAVGFTFMWLLRRMSETAEYESPRGFALAVGVPMFVGMLYVLNVIPAVPLSLKQSGIYHDISRSSTGGYVGEKENDAHMFQSLRPKVFHLENGDTSIYYFSSVGAPAEVSAPISHVWEYYDETSHSWIPSTTVSFDASGGREGGYRAYSKKEHVWPGKWRVTVKVGNNRIVGRITFTIVQGGNVATTDIQL